VSDQRSSYSGGHGGRGGRRGGGNRRTFYSRPRNCAFCSDKSQHIDYKNHDLLRRYVHEDGKIRPRRQTGNCAKHQRKMAIAIKRARHLALLPFTGEVLR
jgi:small subunit ribosomal protein S18